MAYDFDDSGAVESKGGYDFNTPEDYEKPGIISGAIDSIGSAMNSVRDFATGANPKKESVLQGAVPEQGGNFDPMIRPEFVDEFRQKLGELPIEKRLPALEAYAKTDNSVYGRAARVILADEEYKNARVTESGKREAMGLYDPNAVPKPRFGSKSPSGSIAFPESRPNFMEEFDGVTPEKLAKVNELAMGIEDIRQDESQKRMQGEEGTLTKQKADEYRSIGQWASDSVTAVKQGTLSLAQMPTDIIAPDSMLADTFRQVQADFSKDESEPVKAQRELMRKRIESEDGFFGKYVETLTSLITNPALGIQEGLKQIPNFIGIMGVSKLGTAAAQGAVGLAGRASPTLALGEAISGNAISNAAAKVGGVAGGSGAAGMMSAGDAAGTAYEGVMAAPQSAWDANPDYRDLISKGADPFQAKQEIATAKARMAALIAAPIGMVFGYGGAEAALVATGIAKATGQAAAKQGFLRILGKEVAGETIDEGGSVISANKQIQTVDPTRKWDEGLAEATATAALVSGPFAGVAHLASKSTPESMVARIAFAGDTNIAIEAFSQSVSPVLLNGIQTNTQQAIGGSQAVGTDEWVDSIIGGGSAIPNAADQTSQIADVPNVPSALVDTTQAATETIAATSDVNPIARTSDAELLSRVESAAVTSPDTQGTGVANVTGTEGATQPLSNTNVGVSGGNAGQATVGANVATGVPAVSQPQGRAFSEVNAEVAQARVDQLSAAKDDKERLALDKDTPVVNMAEPPAAMSAQLSKIANESAELFGVEPGKIQFFSDDGPRSAEGFAHKGVVYLNTKGLQNNAVNTAWHELDHVRVAMAKADDQLGKTNTPSQIYRDKINEAVSTLTDDAKASYAGNFLYSAEANATPEVQQFLAGRKPESLKGADRAKLEKLRMEAGRAMLVRPKLAKEIRADFVGNRATDPKFLQMMHDADPKGFGSWLKNWIKTLDNLIQSLKGDGKNTQSAAIDRSIKDMDAARKAAVQAFQAISTPRVEMQPEGSAKIYGDIKTIADTLRSIGVSKFMPSARAGFVVVGKGDAQKASIHFKRKDAAKSESPPSGIYAEVAPDPRNAQAKEQWGGLTKVDKLGITKEVMDSVFAKVATEMGLGKGWSIEYTSGMFEGGVNPSSFIKAPAGVDVSELTEVASVLGYILDQKGMVAFDESNTTSQTQAAFVKVILPEGMEQSRIDEIRQAVFKAVPQAEGDTLRDGSLVFGNFSEYNENGYVQLSDDEFADAIDVALKNEPENIEVTNPSKFHSEWIQPSWDKAYSPTARDGFLEGTRYASNTQGLTTGGNNLRGGSGGVISRAWLQQLAISTDRKISKHVSYYGANPTQERRGSSTATGERADGQGVQYGAATPGSVSAVGVHYSQQKRNVLSSSYGATTGLNGLERIRLNYPENKDIKPRINFYVDSGKGVTPESGVGGVKHVVGLNNLYDIKADTLGIVKNVKGATSEERSSKIERMVMQAGFDGYLANNNSGQQNFAVLVGKHEIPMYKRRDVESYDFTDGSIDDINDLGNFNLDDIDVKDLDKLTDAEFAAKIKSELMEEMYGFTESKGKTPYGKKVNLASTLDKTIKSKGLHPEDAFPDFEYKELSDGKKQAAFEVDGKTYFANFKDTVGPRITTENGMGASVVAANVKGDLSGVAESHGFTALSDSAKQAWNKRIATSAELFRRGFDLYTSVSKESRQRVADVWKEIAKNPEAFEFNKAEKPTGKTYQDVAQDIASKMLKGGRYEIAIEKLSPGEEAFFGDGFVMTVKDTKSGDVSKAKVEYDRIGKQVVMHTESLGKGSGAGKPVYQVGQAFATAFNAKIKADHMLLGVNNYRRTEQMFSGMLRSGNYDTMQPGYGQRIFGWNERAKTPEMQERNMVRTALAIARNVEELAPEISKVNYDLQSGRFYLKSKGDTTESRLMAGLIVKRILADSDVRAMSVSRSTLARAAVTLEAIDGEVSVPDHIQDPVLYKRKEIIIAGLAKIEKHLTPAERDKLNVGTAQRLVDLFQGLPPAKEFAAAAWAGRAKRGWYQESAKAIAQIFGADAPRFASLLAAMSPQNSVETNLHNALNTWKNWVAAGRPQARSKILQVMGESVEGNGGVDSVLDAWVNNSVRALTSNNPGEDLLSGPKVDSFMRNLLGNVNEVTNDAWMANFAFVDQKVFKGSLSKTDAGKGPGYLAMSAKVREAATMLTKLTGETWTPAEVQETVWSFAKTLYEAQDQHNTASDILFNGQLTHELIRSTPDFKGLFHDAKYEAILRDAGYGEELDSLDIGNAGKEVAGTSGEAGPFAEGTQYKLELSAAKRLEDLKRLGKPGADRETNISYKRKQPVDRGIEKWAADILRGGRPSKQEAVLSEKAPHPAFTMGAATPIGGGQPFVLKSSVVLHIAKHLKEGITAEMIGMLPAALKNPRSIVFDAPGQFAAILPIDAENGQPILIAGVKDEMYGIRITRMASLYPVENSASYMVREIKKGNRMWLPSEEVSRLRDLLAEPNSPSNQQADSSQTQMPSASRGRNQVEKTFTVLSDAALVKKQAGDKDWAKATENLIIKDDAEKQLLGVAFKRKQPAAQGLPEETRMQEVQRVMQDKYNRVKIIQDLIAEDGGAVGEKQDVYRAEERMHGRVHEVLRQFADDVVHPLIQKAVDFKVDLNELAAYAYAKHAQERNAHIQQTNKQVKTGSGMSDDEADNIIQLVELSQDKAKFEELHNDLLAITATTRRVMLDEGLITQDQYDGMDGQYENYVPLRGFEDVDPDSGSVRPGLGRGFNTKGKETIAAMGRDSKAGDIIENIIRDYERVTIRAERNAVGKTFLDLVTSNPDLALWEVQPITRATRKVNGLVEYVDVADKGDETISVKVAGEQVYIKINDPLLLRAMANTFKSETSDVERYLTNSLGVYTSLLRNTITRYNPAFGVINAVRDSQMGAAGVFDELGAEGLRRYMANYGPAVMSAGRTEFNASNPQAKVMDKWMREMRFAGGTTGGVFMRDHETIRKELRDAMLQAGVRPDGVIEGIRSSKAWWATGKVLHGLELVGSMSENAARLSAYATAREMGKTPAQAASIAKNLTVNFNRFGEAGQLINTAFLFYNASVQGSVRIFQMAKNPKVRYAMAGMAAAGFGLAMMAASVGGDDEDGQPYWDKIPDFEKERNLIIMLPPGSDIGAKVGTHGRYIKIPMAYGLNVFPVLGYQLADLARHAKDPAKGVSVGKAAINMLSTTAGSYNPAGGSFDPRDKVQLAMAVSPTIVDAGIQLGAGVDSFGKPTGPQKSPYDQKPDSENVSAQNHGSINHRIARWINDATGGNRARAGEIDIEPGTIKNVQGIVGGGLGKFIGDVVNLGYLGATDAPISPRDIPIYKAFYGEYDSKSGMSLFYERSRTALEEFDDMKSEHKLGIKRDYSAEEKFLQGMGAYAKNMGEAMGELKKREVYISESKSTDKEKELKRREIQKRREKMAEDFNAKWYDKESKLKRTGS